jgi:catechol 2,3-dioxygenase-like lactoylglutathione lyase family enzyme
MLADMPAQATIAVTDMAKAKLFYGETLALRAVKSMGDDVAVYESGGARIVVYKSEFAGTNKATSATWGVGGEFERIVTTLQSRSVPFEHYNMLGLDRQGDIHTAGDFKAAWFKDPDGNILHINNQNSA